MSWGYIAFVWLAALMLVDDIGLGHIHPVKGIFVFAALVWNVAYTAYKKERKKIKR